MGEEKRVLDSNWERYFSPAVLSRGYRYYEDGCVAHIKPVSRGWQCTVDGSERYSVFVGCDFEDSSCDCPYFFDRGYCKHIAASCYEIEYMTSFEGEESGDDGERNEKPERPDPIVLAQSLDGETLRAYLVEILTTDEAWQADFVRRFGEVDATRLRFEFLDGVRAVVREHSRQGFVDYRSAFQCEIALSRYLDEFMSPLVDRREYAIVFDLTTQLALALQKIAIDDSDGFFSSMLGSCEHYWGIAFNGADASLKQDMFDWMRAFVENGGESDEDDASILWYIQDAVEEVMCNHFASDAGLAEQTKRLAEQIVDQEISEPETFLASDDRTVLRRSTRRLDLWEGAKIRCMRTLGAAPDEIDREIAACPPSLGIIQPLVDEARKNSDTRRARQLLECYVDRLDEGAFSTEAALQLLAIYQETHQDEMRLVMLYSLIVQGRPQNDDQLRSWLRKLEKESGDQWLEYEKELEETLVGSGHRFHEFLAYTGQRKKLAEALEAYGSRYELDHYSNLLAQEYPEKYLAAYEAEVRRMLFGAAQQRKVYASAAWRLRQMQDIPGGSAVVDRIVNELREAYPRRSALMEELDRLKM